MAKKPQPRFVTLGKSKFVHVVYTEHYDLKVKRERPDGKGFSNGSPCLLVRKRAVAGKVPGGSMSVEAALALESCPNCATHEVIEAMQTPDQKRAKRKAEAEETLTKIRDAALDKAKKATKKTAKVKAAKEAVQKAGKVTKTKSGTRSVGASAEGKAEALRVFCEENGWATKPLFKDEGTGHVVVEARDGDKVIHAYFIDGKYDVARHATIEVGAWSGTLRGAHAVRRQVDQSLDDRDRPHPAPGRGRSGPRKSSATEAQSGAPEEDESPEDARRRVPFSLDDPDIEIIDAIKGKRIKWRNGVSGLVEEAWLPAAVRGARGKAKRPLIKVDAHPTTGRRILDFIEVLAVNEDGEVYGPERCVALEKIVRVVA